MKTTETTFLGASEVTKAETLGRLEAAETTFLGASEVTKAATLGRFKTTEYFGVQKTTLGPKVSCVRDHGRHTTRHPSPVIRHPSSATTSAVAFNPAKIAVLVPHFIGRFLFLFKLIEFP